MVVNLSEGALHSFLLAKAVVRTLTAELLGRKYQFQLDRLKTSK